MDFKIVKAGTVEWNEQRKEVVMKNWQFHFSAGRHLISKEELIDYILNHCIENGFKV